MDRSNREGVKYIIPIVKALEFRHEQEYAQPSFVTITMSITEAAQIACLFGELSDKAVTERRELTTIYRDLTANVFNRYWEDGLEGAMRGDRQ